MASFDVYAAVTDRIIQQLEQNVIPWEKPLGGIAGGAISGTTGKPYSLLNQMLLSKPGASSITSSCPDDRAAKKQSIVF